MHAGDYFLKYGTIEDLRKEEDSTVQFLRTKIDQHFGTISTTKN